MITDIQSQVIADLKKHCRALLQVPEEQEAGAVLLYEQLGTAIEQIQNLKLHRYCTKNQTFITDEVHVVVELTEEHRKMYTEILEKLKQDIKEFGAKC